MLRFCILLSLLFIVGCEPPEHAPAVEQMKTENKWQVELCFEKDGYKVYRFRDGVWMDWRYYVTPMGQMVNQTTISDDDGDTKHYHTTPTVR
jgi:hypothetical protein